MLNDVESPDEYIALPLDPDNLIDSTLDYLIRDGHGHVYVTIEEIRDPERGPDILLGLANRVLEAFGDLAGCVQAHVQDNGWKGTAIEIAKGGGGGSVWANLAVELSWRSHAYADPSRLASEALKHCIETVVARKPSSAEEAAAIGAAAFKERPGARRLAQLYLAKFNAQRLAGIDDVAAFFGDEAARRAREGSAPARLARLARIAAVIRQCITPPATSAQNVEVLTMSFAVCLAALQEDVWLHEGDPIPKEILDPVIAPFMRRFEVAGRNIFDRVHVSVILGGFVEDNGYVSLECNPESATASQRAAVLNDSFIGRWRASAFARLEVSHKLAAALCLTDITDSDEIRAPWSAWSLLIPNGLFGENGVARVWCIDKTPIVLAFPSGLLLQWSVENAGGQAQIDMIRALILGSCAALSDPDRLKQSGRWGNTSSAQPKQRRHGPPPEGARYVLAQPVSIDLREAVLDSIGGKHRSGASPKVQFLVRGHWRNQAHGPGRTLRVFRWIEPFWKGPPETRILLRSHKVKKK